MVFIDHPERLLSYDETDVTMDQTAKSKHNSLHIIKAGREEALIPLLCRARFA